MQEWNSHFFCKHKFLPQTETKNTVFYSYLKYPNDNKLSYDFELVVLFYY